MPYQQQSIWQESDKTCHRFAPAYVPAFCRRKGNQLALKITKDILLLACKAKA
jgi:hypothetical protein